MRPTKPYSFDDHPEHKAQLDAWRDRWIANAMSTAPADQPKMRAAMAGLYRAANLTPPDHVVFVRSPLTAAIAGTIAAGVWWLREHPSEHVALFGRRVSEAELVAAIGPACRRAVEVGLATLRGEPVPAAEPVATRAATDAATYAATYAATDAATRAATYAATYAATDAATRAATRAATDAATRAATRAATDAATYDATYAATRAATYAATDAATYAATDAATRDATRDATRAAAAPSPVVTFFIRCTTHWWRMHNGGSDWSAWPAFLSFFRHIAGLNLPEYERWRHYEDAAIHGASRIMHTRFWVVSDRHTEVHVDPQRRLHREDGPARAWGDGWAVWYWHGVRVPRDLIEGDGWTPARILTEPNAEIRRCAIERMGWDAFVPAAGLTEVARCPDPGNPGQEIALYDLPATLEDLYDEPARILLCTNGSVERDGTRRRFGLPVPAHHHDPIAAAAEMYDMPAAAYAQLQRRT